MNYTVNHTYAFGIANVTHAEICFFFFNATNPQVNLNNTKMWCNHIINASYTRHPLLLPVG